MLKLTISKSNLIINRNRSSTGEFYFGYGSAFFPEKDWNDFIDVVLNWWILAFIDLFEGRENEVNLQFMDGNFSMDVLENDHQFSFVLLDGNTRVNLEDICCDKLEFMQDFIEEVGVFLDHCESNNFSNSEIEKMKEKFDELRLLIG